VYLIGRQIGKPSIYLGNYSLKAVSVKTCGFFLFKPSLPKPFHTKHAHRQSLGGHTRQNSNKLQCLSSVEPMHVRVGFTKPHHINLLLSRAYARAGWLSFLKSRAPFRASSLCTCGLVEIGACPLKHTSVEPMHVRVGCAKKLRTNSEARRAYARAGWLRCDEKIRVQFLSSLCTCGLVA